MNARLLTFIRACKALVISKKASVIVRAGRGLYIDVLGIYIC
jgi:hypothetical protein